MPPLRGLPLVLALWIGSTQPAFADEIEPTPDPRALADAYFNQVFGFDALEAYESIRGPARASFVVARRWQDGRSKVLIDVQSPETFDKWALLLFHNPTRSDDLFAYLPALRRVKRLTAIQLENEVIFEMLPLGEVRPIAPGELDYNLLADAEISGETCTVIDARPKHAGLGFDRLELALSKKSGLALESRYFRGKNETRRVLVSPQDVGEFHGRLLPKRRRIISASAPDGETEFMLRNVLVDPIFDSRFFTQHNLRVQRFPSF